MHTSQPLLTSLSTLPQKLRDLPLGLLLLIITIASIGFMMLYSAAQGSMEPWGARQLVRFVILFIGMLVVAMIDIRLWLRYAYTAYVLALVLLVLVELVGQTSMGATRWLKLAGVGIQPSEIMKICLILALARYFHGLHLQDVRRKLPLFPPILMVLIPVGLIIRQPDLGTALILLMTGGMVFFAAGVKWWKFALVIAGGVAALPVVWLNLYDYQKQRILTFLNPDSDPLGAGYNILQSKIAIGSGGVSGKGLLQGTQSQLSFLPEKQTDFIFTMLAEEFGFIGGVVLLLLYGLVIGYGFMIAIQCHNHFGRLLAVGVVSLFFLHIFVNMAMVMGLIPIVGAPLPLLSYGGTIMATMLLGMGLLICVHLHRHIYLDRYESRLG